MKLCKDCKWCSYKEPSLLDKFLSFGLSMDRLEFAKCLHESSDNKKDRFDYGIYVSGVSATIPESDYSYCGTMRNPALSCGPEGKNWEPK